MSVIENLQSLGWQLPDPPRPVANYAPILASGSHLLISGQLPLRDGELVATGPVPSKTSVLNAQQAAAQCVINGLALIGQELQGEWDRLIRVLRLGVFVQSADGFGDQPKVANGASDLLVHVFGDRGRHVRAAVGVNALPLDASVEVEMTVEVRP
jgi:enamine deaminase RidA (YjgF/YER057c/UK114 family)